MVLEIHIIKNQKDEGLIFIPFTFKVLKPLRLPRPVLAEHIYDPICNICTLLIRSAPFSTVASDRVPPSLRHVILEDVWPWTQQKNIAVSLRYWIHNDLRWNNPFSLWSQNTNQSSDAFVPFWAKRSFLSLTTLRPSLSSNSRSSNRPFVAFIALYSLRSHGSSFAAHAWSSSGPRWAWWSFLSRSPFLSLISRIPMGSWRSWGSCLAYSVRWFTNFTELVIYFFADLLLSYCSCSWTLNNISFLSFIMIHWMFSQYNFKIWCQTSGKNCQGFQILLGKKIVILDKIR